jgi:hypothetical protein
MPSASTKYTPARGQDPEPALHRPGLLQHVIDQLERQVLRQLAQMTRAGNALGDTHGMSDSGRSTLSSQRDLWWPARSVVDRTDLSEVPYPSPPTRRIVILLDLDASALTTRHWRATGLPSGH